MTVATYKYTDQGLRLKTVVSGGDICVSNRAGRVGWYGLQATVYGGTNTYAYQQVSFTAASEFRSRFYVNPNTMKMSSGDSFIIYQAYNGSGTAIARVSLEYDGSDYNIKSEASNDASSWSTTQDDVITDAWHYVEIHIERASSAVSANGRMRTWIDGTLEGTTSSLDLYDLFPISTVRWGAVDGVDSGTEGTFYVDGIVLTDSSAEIGAAATDLYKTDPDLVSLWLFEEGADGVTRVDSVGDNDLADHNTVASSDGLEGDYAADFESSSSQHLTIADGSQSGLDVTGEFTICCRIKMEALIGSMVIFNRYKTSTNDRSYQLRVGSDGYVRFYLSSTGTDYTIVKGGTLVSAGNEYSIVATYDGEYGYVYLDGELDTQTGTDPNPGLHGDTLYDASADVYVGLNEGGSLYWDGLIDELAFVNRSFTPNEALGYHENGFQDSIAPAVSGGLAWVVYKLVVNNTSGVRQAEITDFLELAYTKKVNEPGLAVVTFGGDHSIVSTLGHKYQVEVWRTLPRHGIDWYRDFSGLFMAQERFYTDQGYFVLRAPGDMIQLDWRDVLWYSNTSNRSSFSSQPAETILKTLVDYNAGANATTGNGRVRTGTITGLSVETDGGGGNSINWTCAWKNLLGELQKIARVAGGDFDLVKTGAAAWEFRWYTGQRGRDRSSTVIFALERGNMANPVYRYNRMAERTVAAVGGRGQGSARTVVTRTGDDYGASNDVEMFVNAGSSTLPASLNAVGDEKLEQARARQEFGFQALQTPACLYGKHYCVGGELGDLVTARYDAIEVTQKIVGVTVTLAADGHETIDPEMETQ